MNTSPSDSKRYPALEYILPMDREERTNKINEVLRVEKESRIHEAEEFKPHHEKITWKGEEADCYVIKLPVDLPIYNMNNRRLNTEQYQFLASKNINEKRHEYFTKNQENANTQKEAHKWLIEFAKNKNKNIYEVIKKKDAQEYQHPIAITLKGVCINGNRRLASFRDCYYQNRAEFDKYKEIHCMVLPRGTPQDYSDYQAQVQEQPDLTLGYSWVSDIIGKWEAHHEEGLDIAQVAKRYQVKPAKIKLSLLFKEEAETYLKENGRKGMYKDLAEEKVKQIFQDGSKNISKYKKTDIRQIQTARTILHHFLNAKLNKTIGQNSDRLYKYVGPATEPKYIDQVQKKLKEIYNLKTDSFKELDNKFKSLVDEDDIITSLQNIDLINKSIKKGEEGKKKKSFCIKSRLCSCHCYFICCKFYRL